MPPQPAHFPVLATIFFAVLLLAPLVALAVAVVRSKLTPLQCVLWAIAYLLCKFLWRTRWHNAPALAPGQGAIIVCNHRSSVDPFFIQTSTGRKIHWMVAREYCVHPAFRGFLKTCEVIPVGRGGVDTAATKMAIRLAAAGGLVGMLPEGRINMTEQFMLPARPGAALVALKANVPVVPCYIHNAPYRRTPWSPFLMPTRVEIRFGEPLDPAKYLAADADENAARTFTLDILRAIGQLGGQPDFSFQIAGRNWKPSQEELQAHMDAKDLRDAQLPTPSNNPAT